MSTSDRPVREPFACTSCGAPLPLDPDHGPEAISLQCMNCGARYCGKVWDAVPEDLRGNLGIIRK